MMPAKEDDSKELDLWEYAPHMLKENEVIQEGDSVLVYTDRGWEPATIQIGSTFESWNRTCKGSSAWVYGAWRGRHPSMKPPFPWATVLPPGLILGGLLWNAFIFTLGHLLW